LGVFVWEGLEWAHDVFYQLSQDVGIDFVVLTLEWPRRTHFRYLSLLWQNFIKGYYKTNKQAEPCSLYWLTSQSGEGM
jgi:hypothetical protein